MRGAGHLVGGTRPGTPIHSFHLRTCLISAKTRQTKDERQQADLPRETTFRPWSSVLWQIITLYGGYHGNNHHPYSTSIYCRINDWRVSNAPQINVSGVIMASNLLPVPEKWPGRVLWAYVTIIIPIFSFILANGDVVIPEWQTGRWDDFLSIFLISDVTLIMSPLLVYSMACGGLLLWKPTYYAQWSIIRWGIYAGTFLAFQYLIIQLIIVDGLLGATVLVSGGALALFLVGQAIYAKYVTPLVKRALVILAILAVLLFVLAMFTVGTEIVFLIFFPFALHLLGGPFWCLCIGLTASHYLLSQPTKPVPLWMPIAWLTGYLALWPLAIQRMLAFYATLPLEPPDDCYIATAAAQGHPRIVGSRPGTPNNQTIHINHQLRVFKCFELGLMGVHPAGHRHLRTIYNHLGPRLARRLTNPYLADLAYLTLKPLEWLTRLFLRIANSDLPTHLQKIYPTPPNPHS